MSFIDLKEKDVNCPKCGWVKLKVTDDTRCEKCKRVLVGVSPGDIETWASRFFYCLECVVCNGHVAYVRSSKY